MKGALLYRIFDLYPCALRGFLSSRLVSGPERSSELRSVQAGCALLRLFEPIPCVLCTDRDLKNPVPRKALIHASQCPFFPHDIIERSHAYGYP